jgi:hypothetical protein
MKEEEAKKEIIPEAEAIWKVLTEIVEIQKANSIEADKRNAEADKRSAEADKRFDERMQKWDKGMTELRQEIGGIGKSNGDVAEEFIYNVLERDMTFGGVKFDEIDRNIKLKFKKLNIDGEYDVVLQNGDTLAIIETKYKVREEDVIKLFGKKLDDFRKIFPMFSDYKIILGIGGMSFDDEAEAEAKKQGIGVIKVVGEKVEFHTEKLTIY